MDLAHFTEKLMAVLPYWHYKLDRPFKQAQKENQAPMSPETYYCLQMLRCDGPMTMTEMAHRLLLTKQQATRTIDHLYSHGLVVRLPDRDDRRVVRIEVTAQAVEYLRQHIRQNAGFLHLLPERLDAEELDELDRAVGTLLRLLPRL